MRVAYERAEQNQHPDGGFAYWRGGSADVGLTAYVLRFLDLEDAASILAVESVAPRKLFNGSSRDKRTTPVGSQALATAATLVASTQ